MRLPPARSLLWRSLRTYQVYGANTDVGKTIVTTLLCRAARRLWQTENTTYLKPVSTGPAGEADDRCKSYLEAPRHGSVFNIAQMVLDSFFLMSPPRL